MEITAKDYIEAKDKLADLTEGISLFGNSATREETALKVKLNERVRQLEEEFHSTRTRILDARDKMRTPLMEEKEKVEAYILKTNEVLNYLSLQETIEKTDLTEPHPEFYDAEIEAEGEYYKDDYTWARYFIIKNSKPKNCYTLMVAGNSRLEKLFSKTYHILYDYGLPSTKNHYYSIYLGIKDLPSVKELIAYLSKHNKNSRLQEYFRIRDAYINAIESYRLKDFEDLKVIREVQEDEAPIVFTVKDCIFRIYKGFYYTSVADKDKNQDELKYLKIGGELYLRGGRAESYTIKQTGNLTFGDWWSFDFEAGGYGVPFNKSNWERELAEANAYVNESWGNRNGSPNWYPPQITWVHPELIPES